MQPRLTNTFHVTILLRKYDSSNIKFNLLCASGTTLTSKMKKKKRKEERKKKERQKQIDEFFGGRLGLGYNQYLNKID